MKQLEETISKLNYMKGMYVVVALPLPLSKNFIYSVPSLLASDIGIGIPVFVPFGRRNLTGYIIGFQKDAPKGVKPIKEIVDRESLFSPELLELFTWIANYYLTPLGLVIKASIPPRLAMKEKVCAFFREGSIEEITEDETALAIYQELKKRPLSKNYIRRKFKDSTHAYDLLLKKGLIYEETIKIRPAKRVEKYRVRLTSSFDKEIHNNLRKFAQKQAEIYKFLSIKPDGTEKSEIYKIFGNVYSSLKVLGKKNLITFSVLPFVQEIPHLPKREIKRPKLTHTQKEAVNRIRDAVENERYETFLIFGITGSGKTEVYLRTVEDVLKKGKSAIMLVPEISLTAQTVEVFKSRFEETVVIYHSRLGEKERVEVWKGIKEGKYRVVIGARFAVFAPVKNLGAIIVDEEHASTYKQKGKEPLYSARAAAVIRARTEKAVCILGSATPSIESFYNTKKGKYSLIELPKRIDERKLPPVEIVDMRKEDDFLLSHTMKEKMEERIKKVEQIILFINRRGFSNYLVCRDCGFSPRCPFCDLTLTYHRKDSLLKCHYCGYEENAPRRCPKCNSSRFFYAGMGTQRIEHYLEKKFPGLKVMRMDLDTMKRKWAHMESFFRFREGEADLLLGTQMVAKGFDLPKVTLVGVISSDTVLNFPDFRSQERTFQLLTQVAGRTGRGILGGEVVIQTYAPEHYAIKESQSHNYEGFYKKEIDIRKELNYPPFSRLTRIILSSMDEKKLNSSSHELARMIKKSIKQEKYTIEVLGPAPCPLSRLKGKYRYHILLKCKKPFLIQKILSQLKDIYRVKGLHVLYDIDPIDMM